MPKILVVEDDSDQREIYGKLLYYNGFEVIPAGDSREALTLARETHPDLILMDMVLPDLDGISTTNLLKAAPNTADIPVICMSAYDVPRDRAHAAGCSGVLNKPFDGHDLVRAIRREIGWDDVPGGAPKRP